MNKNKRVQLAHGDGGLLSHEMITGLFLKYFNNNTLNKLTDAANITVSCENIAFTTDSFVVKPLFFAGGDIGKLAVCGTVNDLAVSGAIPRFLAASFIIEEGFDFNNLIKIVASMAAAAREAGVEIVTGDTKVVERGNADGLYINTTGIGAVPDGVFLGSERIKPGDVLIINGNIGEHGIAILSQREGISFETSVISDCAALNHMLVELLQKFNSVRFMRDPTRGGLATVLKEAALASGTDFLLFEKNVPVSPEVSGAAEMLGLDPLYLANEGKVLIVASPEEGEEILSFLRSYPIGEKARMIGEVREGKGNVYMETALGGTKFIDMLSGKQLPRIC